MDVKETFAVEGAASYKYTLFSQSGGQYILYLEDEKDPTKRFASDPFPLEAGEKFKANQEPIKLKALPADGKVPGEAMQMAQINRAKLMIPLKGLKFALPDDTLVGLEGLTKFTSRQRLWKLNPDGSLTNTKDSTILRPDFTQGFFVNDKGEKVGVGFRAFAGFYNYVRILTDPRIRGPFFRIFLWTFTFSALSVANIRAWDASVGAPRTAGYPFSADVPHALYFALRGSGGPIDPDLERVVQSGIWGCE